MKFSCSPDYNFKCASCSLFFMLLSAINLPFYDPQVIIHYHQMVDFLLHIYFQSLYSGERIQQNLLFTCLFFAV